MAIARIEQAISARLGRALPDGDLIVLRGMGVGGLFRLTTGVPSFQVLMGAPRFATVLYRTGGWIVAAQAMQQRETSDLGHLAYVSADNGVTWIPVPQS